MTCAHVFLIRKSRFRITVPMIDCYVLYCLLHGVAGIELCFDKTQQPQHTPASTYFASQVMSLEKKKQESSR